MIKTREEWLVAVTDILREDFKNIGVVLPEKIKVSCGWTSGGARRTRRIGECWSELCSRDGNTEIFISPKLDDSLEVTAVLVHELVHAGIGVDRKHGKLFKKVALAMGLTGRMKATTAGDALKERLGNIVINNVGDYPHASLSVNASGREKDGTRLLKVICPSCSYTVRITRKWLAVGAPTCVCGTEMTRDGKVDVAKESF